MKSFLLKIMGAVSVASFITYALAQSSYTITKYDNCTYNFKYNSVTEGKAVNATGSCGKLTYGSVELWNNTKAVNSWNSNYSFSPNPYNFPSQLEILVDGSGQIVSATGDGVEYVSPNDLEGKDNYLLGPGGNASSKAYTSFRVLKSIPGK